MNTASAIVTFHMANPRPMGFTLMELAVTLAVAAILFAVGIPSLSLLVADGRVRTAADNLYASLIFARSEAIKRNKIIAVCAKNDDGNGCQNSSDWARGWIVFVDEDGDGVNAAVSDILKRQDALPGVTLTGTGTNVSFQRDGRLRASVSQFSTTGTGNTTVRARCVSMDLSGRPNVKVASSASC